MKTTTFVGLRTSLKVTILTLAFGAACLGTGQVDAEGGSYTCWSPPYDCYKCMYIPLFGSRCITTLPGVVGKCNCDEDQIFPMGTMCTLGGRSAR